MKLDFIKEKKELISVVLSGISVLFAVLICMKIISYFKISIRTQNIEDSVRTIITKDSTKTNDLDKYLGPTKEIANSLKKNNLFAPPQPKRNPITSVPCILGDEVFINNKWYKEGEMVQDAKIIAIEPTQVTIEWDGKTTVYRPLDAPGASPGPGERPPSMPGSTPPPPGPGTVPIPTPRAPMASSGPVESAPSRQESTQSATPSTVPIPPSLQGLPPGLAEERIKNEVQKMRLMIQEKSSAERN